jgi:hypothetical protein
MASHSGAGAPGTQSVDLIVDRLVIGPEMDVPTL